MNNEMNCSMNNDQNNEMNHETKDVSLSVWKLLRSVRRHPLRPEHEFPPAVERLLFLLTKEDGVSPACLCEKMDIRPSSMSELLGRMEEKFLVKRVADEADKRATKVFLTDTGREAAERRKERIREEKAQFSACFTEEETEQFIALCDKLSVHLETLGAEKAPACGGPGHHGFGRHGGFGPRGCSRFPGFGRRGHCGHGPAPMGCFPGIYPVPMSCFPGPAPFRRGR